MPEKTIIITGSSGYLGSKILSRCRRLGERNVIGLDFKNADINLDLMDYKQLVDIKNNFGQIELVHLAGQLPGTDSSINLMNNSIQIVRNLVETLKPTRTLFISSTAVYPTICIGKNLAPAPWEAYGCSKMAVENFLRENSSNFSIFRSGTMFDKNRTGGIQKLLTSGLLGKPVFIPKSGNIRHPFVSTSDVVESILYWIDNPEFLNNEISDLVASDPITLNALISKNSETKSRILNLPDFARKFGSDSFPIFGISKWHINALYYDIAHQLKVSKSLEMKPMMNLFH
jgi:nucleoside-diphosphate-sugar epimerase